MAKFITQTEYVNNVATNFEEKLATQYSRILQSAPTPVTYYHINNIESTTDSGFLNIENLIGKHSPLRFNQVKNFPLYNVPSIQLDITDVDYGLDFEFDGEAVLLPNTIKPFPNDFFIINLIKQPCLFRVTSVSFDTIKSNNYYKINFSLRTISEQEIIDLEAQVTDRFTCVPENIGTEDNWLIADDKTEILETLTGDESGSSTVGGLIGKLLHGYKLAFYNEKCNVFLYEPEFSHYIYDRYVNKFIFDNELYYDRMSTDALVLTCEDWDRALDFEYEESIFHAIEKKKLKMFMEEYKFRELVITNPQSIFNFYDMVVNGVRYKFGGFDYLSQEFSSSVKSNTQTDNTMYNIIIDFMNGNIETLYQLDLDAISSYNFRKYSLENYILVPIVIYILKNYVATLTSS